MNDYKGRIEALTDVNVDSIIEDCYNHLPESYKFRPYHHPDLKHGVDLLKTDEALDCYMAAYGEMHLRKCKAAVQTLNLESIGVFEIWDWGCGQGIATMGFLEFLRDILGFEYVKRITLVEPSEEALNRAVINIEKFTNSTIPIIPINRFLPSEKESNDEVKKINYDVKSVIHFFSNILDVREIDLVKLARLLSLPGHEHYIMAFGPMNQGSNRLDLFESIFNKKKSLLSISSYDFGYTTKTKKKFTCKANCFISSGYSLDHNYAEKPEKFDNSGLYLKDDYDIAAWIRKACLPESIIPFYNRIDNCRELNIHDSIFIAPEIYGNKTDFIILRPSKGVLLLNVLEGEPSINSLEDAIMKINSLHKNLMREYLEDVWGKIASGSKTIWSIIKMAIVFSDVSSEKLYDWLAENQEAIQEDNDNKIPFEKKGKGILCGVNHVILLGNDAMTDAPKALPFGWFAPIYDNENFSDLVYKSILQILSPKWHTYKEGKGIELNREQKKLASFNSSAKQINGVAGSGKTQVMMQRAVNTHIATGKDILILCYNITLVNYLQYRLNQVSADFARNRFNIHSYHRFFKANALSLDLKPKKKFEPSNIACDENNENDEYQFSYDDLLFFKNKKEKTKKYSFIFIDEIQDFKPVWIQIIREFFLEKNGEIIVFGDASQNIYNRKLDDKKQIKIDVGYNKWNNSLKTPLRFLNPILAKITSDFKDKFILKNDSELHSGGILNLEENKYFSYSQLPFNVRVEAISLKLIEFFNANNLIEHETAIITTNNALLREIEQKLKKHNYLSRTTFASSQEIEEVRLNNSRYPESDIENIERSKRLHFTVERRGLKLSTIHCFKGWEINNLIVIIPENETNSELIYTALTRARKYLYVISCNNHFYHEFFNKQQDIYGGG